MMNHGEDTDSALAYGMMMIFLYFGFAALIWISWTVVYDMFLGVIINPYIVAGSVSVQTAHATEWNVNFIRYAIPIILLFGFVFAINWAIYKSGGGIATFTTFWWGFIAFLICCVCGLFLAFWGGYFIDVMHEQAITLPGHDSSFALNSEWLVYWYINAYYLVCYVIPVLGAVIFGQSIVKRVRASQYSYR
jgi:hypothetical protein